MVVGSLVFIAYLAFFVYLLILLVRFVNAIEKIANSNENHERQMGRLATAIEQLVIAKSGDGGKPKESPDEGSAHSSTGKTIY